MNRFSIVLGHYVFCVLNHGGQGSDLYARLCHITWQLGFDPGPLFSEERFLEDKHDGEDPDAYEVYVQLCEQYEVAP